MKTTPDSTPAIHCHRLDPAAIRRPHGFSQITLLAAAVSLALLGLRASSWATEVTVGGGATIACPAVPTATYTTPPTGVSFSNWSRGSGVNCASANNGINGRGFNVAGAATAYSGNKYYQITITADSTHNFTLSSVTWLATISSGSGTLTVYTSNNGGAATAFGSPATSVSGSSISATFNGNVVVAPGTSVDVYFIPSDLAAGTTTCRYKNGSTFTLTAAVAPTVSSSAATSVGSTTAILNGSVDSDGGSEITQRGFVYKIGTGVTITDNQTPVNGETGAYDLHLTTLSPGTLYSFKAYAINAVGTTLSSPELTFTTSASATAPAVDSPTSSAIGVTTATLGATVQSDDGVAIDDYGVVWGLSANPTTADNKIQKGTSSTPPETFTVSASGLNVGTLIHYRGYAHNSVGTGYTTNASFSTLSTEPTLQASGVTFMGVGDNDMTINFTSGNGSSRIVLMKSGSAVDSDPVDGTTYTASTTFGSGSQIGTNNFVVYTGSGNSVTISGLSPGSLYHVAVYEFNGSSSGTENYLTTSPAINSQQTTAHGAAIYTWNQTGSADWTTATNWTPARNAPATDDILLFNNGANTTVLSVPAQTIGKLQVSGNTTVNLQAGAANTLTIGTAAVDAMTVASGSQLNVNGTNALIINLASGAKGSISGSMTFSTAANRLTAANAIGITFNSGSTFTQGAGNTGNVFGSTGTANTIVFASGATFISKAGANPFGLGEPNSKVIFQAGSLFSHQQTVAASFSGRNYANFEQNVNATITVIGANAVSMDDLTVTQGTLNFNMTSTPDHSIKGNITVANGATLNFTPATAGTVNLNGSSLQTISGGGNVSVSTLSTIVIDNPEGVSLQKSITIDGAIMLTDGIVTSTDTNLLTISSTGTISGGSATSYLDPRVAQVYSGTGPKTFPIGKGGNFRPLTVNSTQAGTSTITAEQFESALTGSLPTNACLLESRFWTVTRAEGNSFTYDITLNAPGFTPAGPLILKKDGSIAAFTASQAGDNFTKTGLSSLGDFAVGQTCAPPTATVSGDQTICTGGSATIQAFMTGTGPWSITWSDSVTETNFSDNPHTRIVSPTSLTTYTVTAVSDSTGITGGTSSGSATVTVNAQPSGPTLATKSPDLLAVCDGQSVSATFTAGSGGVGCSDSYQFSTDNGATYGPYTPGNPISTVGSTGVIIQGKRDGCASGAGCTGTPFTTLASWTVNPPPTCSITPPSATVCAPQTQQFCAPAGMSSYAWTGPAGFTASSQCITVSTGGTYTVTIVDGDCTNSCQATLAASPPTIACPSNITTTNDAGLCSALVAFSPAFTGSLECKIGATVITSPHVFDIGTNMVSCTASNDCGTTNCAFTVVINDTEPPTIASPANVLTNTDAGLCVVSNVVLGVPVSTNDNCSVATVVNDAPGDLTFGTGTNAVVWTVTDIHGNQSTSTQQVIVVDNEVPTINCPADVMVNADSGLCTASGVSLGVPSATNDNCGVSNVVNNASEPYPVGTNDVVWTVTDIHDNSATCTQQVIVVDNQAPTISCPADISVTNITTVTWSLGVNDNCPGVTGGCSPTNGSTFAAGTTGVNCTATDASGNTDNCSFNVTVVTNATVTISCPDDVTVPSAPGQCSSNLPFAVTVSGDPTPSVECKIGSLVITSPYLFPVGTNVVDCTASNDNDTATCSFTVTIQDTEAPTISCPDDLTVNTDSGLCTASDVDLGVPSATNDNCGVSTVVNNASEPYPVGTNAVVWTVTDIHGNSAACTQQVIVVDDQAPTIDCPASIVTSADPGQCGKSNVTYTAMAMGNCTNVIVSCTPASGSTFALGTNSVTCTATDSSGNTNGCTFTVTVVVDEPPVVSCPANIVTSVDPGQCAKSNITYSATASDPCSNVTLSYNPPNGSTLPAGTTTVYVNATDSSGNSAAIKVFGNINTDAGNGIRGYAGDGGPATNAHLNSPYRVAVDSSGNRFIADLDNQRIRRVDAATGIITTVAGNGIGGYSGDGMAATNASLNSPTDVAVDGSGNLFIADFYNERIRRVDAVTGIITTVAGNGIGGYGGDGGAATNARLNFVYGLAVDRAGNLYIADSGNNRIRWVNAATGIITTVAGNGSIGYSGDGGAATNARMNGPFGVGLDRTGNLYIADFYNARIRRVNAATGIITTVAGNGSSGYNGDGGAAIGSKLYAPFDVAVDGAGNLFIADWFNYRVRRVDTGTGIISTVAGNGTIGSSGDGGAATSARLADPTGVAVDRAGNLFVTELNGQRVRRVDAAGACTFTVTVNETTPPSIICPPNIVTSTTAGTCVASNVTWTVSASDNCTAVTTNCTPASGSTFAIGTNTVICTVNDSGGNTNSCSFTVTVEDAQPPVISTCASNQTLSANGSCQAVLPDLTSQVVATDNCGGTPTVTQSPAAGTLLGLGTNSVTCTVTGSGGNSNSCIAMVIVRDFTPPVIGCPSNITVNANPDVCFATGVSLGTVMASDDCGVAAVSSNAPASFPVGTNAVVWTAMDLSGNSATCTQRVVVVDNQVPVITCPADLIVRIPVEVTHAQDVVLASPFVADNCGVNSLINDASSCYAVGTNLVVWTGTDPSGNSATCTQRVIVVPVTVTSADIRIVNIGVIGQNVRLTWETFGSSTNIIQSVSPVFGGSYSTNYINVGSVWVPGAGSTITNWIDFGGATNFPSRYYRISFQPVDPSCAP